MSDDIYQIEVRSITGETYPLDNYRGKVLLIVNTASQCGFTPQYKGLQDLHERYEDRGLVVLGFPCNQFGEQEPGGDEEIASFCSLNHGVSFPLHSKVDVNGSNAHPLFIHLKNAAPGLMGSKAIKWNFTKFIVNTSGDIIKRYGPKETPSSLSKDIELLLPQAS